MRSVADMARLGYTIEFNARRYAVFHRGREIGKGGREEYPGDTPFDVANWRAAHRQCAIWVAERHLARHTAGDGVGDEMGGDVHE